MTCPLGRDICNPDHPTCKSFIAQGGKCTPKKAKKRKAAKQVETWYEDRRLFTTQYMYSVNHWHGKGIRFYLSYKGLWVKVLAGTWALWGKATGKRRVIINRQVKFNKNLIADTDNFYAGCKPILDLLTRQGVILDDSADKIELVISQHVGVANIVEIQVEEIE